MLIQCPACGARAKLPDSKEGAKVRCGECSRVYLAAPVTARAKRGRGRSKGPNTGLMIGVGVGVVALVVLLIISRSGGGAAPVVAREEPVPEPAPVAVLEGWKSELVQAAVGLHTAAYAHDETRLRAALHGPRLWQAAGRAEGGEDFVLLPDGEKLAFIGEYVESLANGPGKELVADWKPYDGTIIEQSDDEALVRLEVRPHAGMEKRWVEWHLARDGVRWKAWAWERWVSPDEVVHEKKTLERTIEKVTLSDGSVVEERKPEPLEHLADTPPELRARIDELYATMIDLDLTREATRAQQELIEIGRPAIPVLLTGLYEIPLDTQDQAIQCNLIVQTLRQITGQFFGYKPQAKEGSGTGTTEERRQSSIKQWFAWWARNEKKFDARVEETDALEELIELDAKEERWLERNK